jgi:hypothetical protein
MVRHNVDYDVSIAAFLIKSRGPDGTPIPRSFTDIYKMIVGSGHPNVGKDTIQRHLDKLVKTQVLVRRRRAKSRTEPGIQYNKTPLISSAFTDLIRRSKKMREENEGT